MPLNCELNSRVYATGPDDEAEDASPPSPPQHPVPLNRKRRTRAHTAGPDDEAEDTDPLSPSQPSVLPNRKQKPRIHTASLENEAEDADSPSPSQCSRPRKRGRLSHQPTTLVIDDGEDNNNQFSGEEDNRKRQWTKAEVMQFVHALMGPDGYWEKFLKNPNDVLKKVGGVVGDGV